MSDTNLKSYRGGVSFSTLIFTAFLFCKLAKVTAIASWSWWLVTAPLWIMPVFTIGIILISCLIAGLAALYKLYRDDKKTNQLKSLTEVYKLRR